VRKALVRAIVASALVVGVAPAALAGPEKATCAGIVGVNHGHHVIAAYVNGGDVEWPPAGQVDASGGAALPGGPGAGGHIPAEIAPGASFCIPQSQSPGWHVGG
jgi:hypothetical protein